jgi:hypothetical protein
MMQDLHQFDAREHDHRDLLSIQCNMCHLNSEEYKLRMALEFLGLSALRLRSTQREILTVNHYTA